MKKLLIPAALVLITLVSCKKNDRPADSSAEVQIQKLMNANDFHSEVQIFTLMEPGVKHRLWYNHLKEAKVQFEKAGDLKKVMLIDEFLGKMSTKVFVKDSKEQVVFLSYFMPEWSSRARKEFTDLGFYDLLGNLKQKIIRQSIPSTTPVKNQSTTNVGSNAKIAPDCFCHEGQLGYTCSTTTTTFSASTSGEITVTYTITQGRCEKNEKDCTRSSLGCGTLWLFSCGGNSCNYG